MVAGELRLKIEKCYWERKTAREIGGYHRSWRGEWDERDQIERGERREEIGKG